MIYSQFKSRLILLNILVSTGFSSSFAAQNVPLPVVPVVKQQIEREYTVDGVVEAINQAQLSAQTAGQVLEVNFEVDDTVKKGEVLVRLKSLEQKASLAQVKARVAEAKAYLNAAQKEFKRSKELRAKRVISAAQLDKAGADLEASQARLHAAQADVRQASQQVQYTTIKAPYSGIVLKRHIQTGEVASLGQPIMTGFSLDALRVVASIPQSQMSTIRQYQKAYIILEAKPKERRFKGRNFTVAPYANAKTHTFQVRLDLPKKVKGIYPGMFVKVAFAIGKEQRLMIPVKSVVYRGEVRAVYIVDQKGQIFMRQVRLGRKYSDMIEVLAGLEVGENIATAPINATIMLKAQRNQIKTSTEDHP
jgi:RND family efflux transporter MFP subunit